MKRTKEEEKKIVDDMILYGTGLFFISGMALAAVYMFVSIIRGLL